MSNPNTDLQKLVTEAAIAISNIMGTEAYAVVGGAACNLLGSERATTDVDIVVPRGQTASARARFRESDQFSVEPATAHTYYKCKTGEAAPVEIQIQILTPPVLFCEAFDASTPVLQVLGVNVLKPSLVLNALCKSLLARRAHGGQKPSDAEDILFLLRYFAGSGPRLLMAEVPNATRAFVDWFVQIYGNRQRWVDAGFHVD